MSLSFRPPNTANCQKSTNNWGWNQSRDCYRRSKKLLIRTILRKARLKAKILGNRISSWRRSLRGWSWNCWIKIMRLKDWRDFRLTHMKNIIKIVKIYARNTKSILTTVAMRLASRNSGKAWKNSLFRIQIFHVNKIRGQYNVSIV